MDQSDNESIEQCRNELLRVNQQINHLRGKLGGLQSYANKLRDKIVEYEASELMSNQNVEKINFIKLHYRVKDPSIIAKHLGLSEITIKRCIRGIEKGEV